MLSRRGVHVVLVTCYHCGVRAFSRAYARNSHAWNEVK